MTKIRIIRWRFGYRLSGEHGGCWINDYDCGRPDCPMARFDGRPEVL